MGRVSVSSRRALVGLDTCMNGQHCHPHGHTHLALLKIKIFVTFLSNHRCARIHLLKPTLESLSCLHRHGVLHRDTRCRRPKHGSVLHRARALSPAFLSPNRHSPLADEFFERRSVVHGNCSHATFFTTPSRLPVAILPFHGTRAPLAGYHNSPLCRPCERS